jgi:phosphatidylglycerol---prolipoprotein diacylglyceryl transferase
MALPYPDIGPNLLTIPALKIGAFGPGPFPLRWYALGYIAGILLGWQYAKGLCRNLRLWGEAGSPVTELHIDDLIVWLTFGIILGGRIGYVVAYMLPLPEQRALLLQNPLELIAVWHGGMASHGGILGVTIAGLWFARRNNLPILSLGDIIAASAPFGLFLVRIANFINGELWGRPTTLPWGMVFCTPRLMDEHGLCPAGLEPRHPSQLYEATLEGLALFLIMRLATHRFGALKRPGLVMGLFMLGYAIVRISLENVRMPASATCPWASPWA